MTPSPSDVDILPGCPLYKMFVLAYRDLKFYTFTLLILVSFAQRMSYFERKKKGRAEEEEEVSGELNLRPWKG